MSQTPEFEAGRPSNVRYIVLAFLCTLAFIFYLDRVCIGQAAADIQKELDLTETQMGFVLAGFTLAYSLFEVPIGWWGDRYGSRGVMARIVIGWSIFTALTGAAWGLTSLIAIRFLFGAGEAGAFPNTARILSRWFPVERRGMAQGLVNAMSQVGGACAPVVTAFMIGKIGWRWTFVIFSVPGVIWAAAFYYWFRDDPQTHPAVNDAERRLIADGTVAHQATAHAPIPWRVVLSTPQIWLLGFVLMCSAFNTYFYFSWYPNYLKKGRGLHPDFAGLLASVVLAGGAIGCTGGGLLIDYLIRRTGNRHLSRRLSSSLMLLVSAAALICGRFSDSPVIASLFTACSVMFTVSTLASWWGAVTDISGRHLGALFGLMNSIGGLGAIASQLFVGPYVNSMAAKGFVGRDQWDSLFFIYAGVLVAGACGWLFVDSSRSVDSVSGDDE